MRKVILLLFLCHAASAVTHSLKYFYIASSGVTNLPEFEAVGLVDGVQMIHYDSNTRRAEPTQDWMNEVTADDPQYWERQTQGFVKAQQVFKENIETSKQRFNQTGGVHVFQLMYGCEWDNETGAVNGFHQYSYDGEDFIVFDLKTETWTAPTPQAFITKLKWDNDKALTAQKKQYLSEICPEWLKKYVNYGRSSLLRTEKHSDMTTTIIIITAVVVLALVLTAVIGFIFCKRRGESQTQKNPDSSVTGTKTPLPRGSETSLGGSNSSSTLSLKSITSGPDSLLSKSSSTQSVDTNTPLIRAESDS